jgi:hypothetical protein
MASLDNIGAIQDCDCCGAVAETEVTGADGRAYWMCVTCNGYLQDTLAAREDEPAHNGVCDDCQEEEATCRFMHLDGRQFRLCAGCWHFADHEDDYMQRMADADPGDGEERAYDWGEEREDDFAAEESEYDDCDGGGSEGDFFASSLAAMRIDGTYALLTRVG